MKNFELRQIIKEEIEKNISLKKNIPSDVKNLDIAQKGATTVISKSKAIDTPQEFSGAFENWFQNLGYKPGKISKSFIRTEIEKVLTTLGYK